MCQGHGSLREASLAFALGHFGWSGRNCQCPRAVLEGRGGNKKVLTCLERRQDHWKWREGGGQKNIQGGQRTDWLHEHRGLTRHVEEWGAEETCQGVKKKSGGQKNSWGGQKNSGPFLFSYFFFWEKIDIIIKNYFIDLIDVPLAHGGAIEWTGGGYGWQQRRRHSCGVAIAGGM